MKIVLRLAPGFLRRFDEYVRMNYPWFWATRFHLNIYMAIIIIPLVTIIALLIPADHSGYNDIPVLVKSIPVLFIPSIAWLIFQFRQLSLYNVDKSYGMQSTYREFLILLIYIVTFLLPLSLPAIATSILEHKTNHMASIGGVTWKVVLVLSFYIGVFFNIFKQVRAKNFFLTFAFGGGIMYLLSTFSAILMVPNIFIHGIMYLTIIISVYTIIGFAKGKRNFLLHQSTILLNILFPILGIILLSYMSQVMDLFQSFLSNAFNSRSTYSIMGAPEMAIEDSWLATHIWEITLWGGLILHLFLWNSFFKRAYFRLWNQPKSR